jgi:hypothetical protein
MSQNPCFNLTLTINTSSYNLLIAITNVFSAFSHMTSHVLSSHRPDKPPSHQPLSISAPTTIQPLSLYYPPLNKFPKPTTPYTHYPPIQHMPHRATLHRTITQHSTTQHKHTKTSTPVKLERRSNCKQKPKHKALISVSTSTCASTWDCKRKQLGHFGFVVQCVIR